MKVKPSAVEKDARIVVFGVGGGGCNAVNYMAERGLVGATLVAANTDTQVLEVVKADVKIVLGKDSTRGLGAGGDPEVGRKAAEESQDEIIEVIDGADMVFIAAGMGGGTGTGAAPVVARLARERDILTMAVVTKPFKYEGRRTKAERGIRLLRETADSCLVISNDKLLELASDRPITDSFGMANEVLYLAVKSMVDLIKTPGLINVDFADVRAITKEGGLSMFGVGEARGEDRAAKAVARALEVPLLDDVPSIKGARGVLLNVHSGAGKDTITMEELRIIAERVREEAADGTHEPEIITGAVVDPEMGDMVRVTIIATGLSGRRRYLGERRRPFRASETRGQKGLYDFPVVPPTREDEGDWAGSGLRA